MWRFIGRSSVEVRAMGNRGMTCLGCVRGGVLLEVQWCAG